VASSDIGFSGGRYQAASIDAAMRRAASQLFRRIDNDAAYKQYADKRVIKFQLKETTKGSKGLTRAYKAERSKLAEPVIVKLKFNGEEREVVHNYEMKVRACHEFEPMA
jgi:hypothetical protein